MLLVIRTLMPPLQPHADEPVFSLHTLGTKSASRALRAHFSATETLTLWQTQRSTSERDDTAYDKESDAGAPDGVVLMPHRYPSGSAQMA